MKKKLLFAMCCTALLLAGCAKKKVFIEGNIEGIKGTLVKDYVYLYEYGGPSAVLVDSALMSDEGAFVFYQKDKGLGEYAIRSSKDEKWARDIKRFFLDTFPVTIKGDLESRKIEVYGNKADSLYYDYRMRPNYYSQDSVVKYVVKYKDNIIAPHILMRHFVKVGPYELIDSLINQMTPEVQNTTLGRRVRFVNEARENSQPGKKYRDIEDTDVNGNIKKLSDVVKNNKYTLLTFWATWCGDCRDHMPKIKSAYEKHNKDGFGVYSVSMDYEREKWENYLKDNNIEWINVSSLKGWDDKWADLYFVQTITTMYIIDQNGIIVDKLVTKADKERIDEKIDELFSTSEE